jgi:hypothetical protein
VKRFLQFLAIVAIFIFGFPSSPASAQQASQWTDPIDLSNSVTQSQFPSITADPAGGVHVVWLENLSATESAILYTSLSNGNWSSPVDIVPDVGNVGGPRLISDEQGTLHLAYPGINGISYAQAFAPQAGSPRAWSKPVILVPAQNFLSDFDLAVGTGEAVGTVCVTYAKQIGSGSGVYVVCSRDGGLTWDEPYIVYENLAADLMVSKPRLAIGPDGSLQVVWVLTNYPETFPPLGIRYSKSIDGGLTWSSEFNLADGPYDDPTISLCAAPQVHVVWSGTGSDRFKFHRWSADNGKTWFDTWRNTDLGGYQGRPDLVCDSRGRIHWLLVGTAFGNVPKSVINPDSLYHAVFDKGKWSPGDVLLYGSSNQQNMADAQAAIALGNQIHVVVYNPLQLSKTTYQNDIFYISELLDGPALQPKLLLNANLTITPTPPVLITLSPSPSPTPLGGEHLPPDTTPWQAVGMGALVALVVIILAFILRYSRSRQ